MNEDKDFEHRGYMAYYLPHPKLYGNYEIWHHGILEEYITRVPTKQNAIDFINGRVDFINGIKKKS